MNESKRFRKPAAVLFLAAALAAAVCAELPALPASASEEQASASYTLPETALKAHSSYATESYFGVRNLAVADNAIAYASVDSQNRVVITAVGSGSTTVSYWYKTAANSGWIGQTLPVRVSGKSDSPESVSLSALGIVFPSASVALTRGKAYPVTGLKLNGEAVDASKLLWVSSDETVATVGRETGEITGISSGTAAVFAIDPVTRTCAGVTVTVS